MDCRKEPVLRKPIGLAWLVGVIAVAGVVMLATPLVAVAAPVTTVLTSPAASDGLNGWFKTTPTVTLDSPGATLTQYAWDAAGMGTYVGGFVAPEGTHQLSYRSRDGGGSWEATKTRTFKVDTTVPTAPTITGSIEGPDSIRIVCSGASDSSSYISFYEFYDGPTRISGSSSSPHVLSYLAAGTHVITVRAKDAAGTLSGPSNTVTLTLGAVTTTPASSDWSLAVMTLVGLGVAAFFTRKSPRAPAA